MYNFSTCRMDAKISSCNKYRYSLSRIWDESKKNILFIMLNPSWADDKTDDRTIIRCMNFAHSWGYGGIDVGNLFAFRTHKPIDLFACDEPVGVENDKTLAELRTKNEITVFAWGNNGTYKNRNLEIQDLFKESFCLQKTVRNNPKHPLYVPATCQLIKF